MKYELRIPADLLLGFGSFAWVPELGQDCCWCGDRSCTPGSTEEQPRETLMQSSQGSMAKCHTYKDLHIEV
jgi:hypothetical protein